MLENTLIQEYEDKTKNIDQIAEWTMTCKQKNISQKYANIYSTVKLLKNLISDFTKKSYKVQDQFRKTAKIQNLTQQTEFHQKRIEECQKLSNSLFLLMEEKKRKLEKYQIQAKQFRDELVLAKTNNIKKIVRIQMIQSKQKQNREKDMKLLKKKVNIFKIQENRALLKTSYNKKNDKIILLKIQKDEATKMLWNKINTKISLQNIFRESYKNLKQKLLAQQKKSNIYGLTGSLLFNLIQNQNKDQLSIKPYLNLKFKDSKLMIYDVLKQKHEKQTKIQKQKQKLLTLPFEKFITFNNIQILGLIELKGGLIELKQKGDQHIKDSKKDRKKQKKQNRYISYVKTNLIT